MGPGTLGSDTLGQDTCTLGCGNHPLGRTFHTWGVEILFGPGLGENYGGSVDCTTQLLPMTRPMFTSTNDSIHVIPWTQIKLSYITI